MRGAAIRDWVRLATGRDCHAGADGGISRFSQHLMRVRRVAGVDVAGAGRQRVTGVCHLRPATGRVRSSRGMQRVAGIARSRSDYRAGRQRLATVVRLQARACGRRRRVALQFVPGFTRERADNAAGRQRQASIGSLRACTVNASRGCGRHQHFVRAARGRANGGARRVTVACG